MKMNTCLHIDFPSTKQQRNQALEIVKSENRKIRFMTDSGSKYDFPALYAYIHMNEIKLMLNSLNPSATTYLLKAKVSDTFFQTFFQGLDNESLDIQENDLFFAISVADELKINRILIEAENFLIKNIFHIYSNNDSSGIIYEIPKLYEFIAKNINIIEPKMIKALPLSFQRKIFEAKNDFINEDQKAEFIITNNIDKELFHFLDFTKFSSKVMQDVLQYINKDPSFIQEFYSRIEASNNDNFNNTNSDFEKKYIQILCIYPKVAISGCYEVFSPELLNLDKENKKYIIKATSLSDVSFRKCIEIKKDFLSSYKVVLIGFCNASHQLFMKTNSFDEEAKECFIEYHKKGGKIVLLHDCFYSPPQSSIFYSFKDLLGDIQIIKNYEYQDSVQLLPDGELLNEPFSIKSAFTICESHPTYTYSNMTPLVAYNRSGIYCQRTKDEHESIYICEAYHSGYVTEMEEKLLYNIIVRMSTK